MHWQPVDQIRPTKYCVGGPWLASKYLEIFALSSDVSFVKDTISPHSCGVIIYIQGSVEKNVFQSRVESEKLDNEMCYHLIVNSAPYIV